MRCFYILLMLLLSPASALATSPCTQQTPEQFQSVKDGSDLIIHAQVMAYYRGKQPESHVEGVTWLRVLNTYKGKADGEVIKVKWVSDYLPLYSYKKDSEVVLLLKQKGGDWYLTDDSWKKCVPAVIGLPATFPMEWKGKTYTREEFIEARLNP